MLQGTLHCEPGFVLGGGTPAKAGVSAWVSATSVRSLDALQLYPDVGRMWGLGIQGSAVCLDLRLCPGFFPHPTSSSNPGTSFLVS